MGEEKKPRIRMGRQAWMTVFFCGMGMTAFDIQYLVRNYYVLYKEATGNTDGQIGTILSAVGVAAVIAYFYNGFLSDLVKPRTLLSITYCIAIASCIVLMLNPGYIVATVCFVVFALTPLWAPVTKLIASTTPEELSGKVFGWLDSFNGLTGLVIGFVASWIVAKANAAVAMRLVLILYMCMAVLSLIGLQIICSGGKGEVKTNSEEDKRSIKNLSILFRDPNQWLVWLGIAFGYTGYIGLTYLSPMLAEYFGVSTAAITALNTIQNNGITFVLPIISGWLSDKAGAVRSYFIWLAFYILSMGIVLIIPWTPAFFMVGILSVLLLACSVKGRSPLSSSMLTHVRTPLWLFGTSVGIESLILTIPDTFAYSIAAGWIEKYQMTGYKYVFLACLVFAVLGLVCNIILDKRMRDGKTSEKFFAQLRGEAVEK